MNDAQDTPRDPALSRLYVQASRPEPPPALDAAILAAARAATTPQRPPHRPWWLRLQAPLALAATAILAIALTLSIDRTPPGEFGSPASVPGQAPPATERAAPASPDAGSASLPGTPAAVAPARKEAPPRAESKRGMPAVAQDGAAPAPAPAATASSAPAAGAAKGLASPTADAANENLAGGEHRKARAAPAATPTLQASREAAAPMALKPPETWLEEIRALRSQGKFAEADRALSEFRAAYPDYRLPEDFR